MAHCATPLASSFYCEVGGPLTHFLFPKSFSWVKIRLSQKCHLPKSLGNALKDCMGGGGVSLNLLSPKTLGWNL